MVNRAMNSRPNAPKEKPPKPGRHSISMKSIIDRTPFGTNQTPPNGYAGACWEVRKSVDRTVANTPLWGSSDKFLHTSRRVGGKPNGRGVDAPGALGRAFAGLKWSERSRNRVGVCAAWAQRADLSGHSGSHGVEPVQLITSPEASMQESDPVKHAQAMFNRVLSSWAIDVLALRKRGWDVPCRRLARVEGVSRRVRRASGRRRAA